MKRFGIGISNGLCWSRSGREFFYIATPTHELRVFEFDASNVALSNPRVVEHFDARSGSPDSMTIDPQGQLWVSLRGDSKVLCIAPDTGEVRYEVNVPATNATSVHHDGVRRVIGRDFGR